MKKIFKKIRNRIADEDWQESILLTLWIIDIVAAICLGCLIADKFNQYWVLTIFTYIAIACTLKNMDTELICGKLYYFFVKKYELWKLIHIAVIAITIILSYKYFFAFLLCIPQAFVNGKVSKLKKMSYGQEKRVL